MPHCSMSMRVMGFEVCHVNFMVMRPGNTGMQGKRMRSTSRRESLQDISHHMGDALP